MPLPHVLSSVVALLGSGVAHASIPQPFDDATVIERADLVVVGHLERDSILTVDHPNTGPGHEHHATLVITRLVKGEPPGGYHETRIPIVIHLGLTPVVDGYWTHRGSMIKFAGPPTDGIQIIDSEQIAPSNVEDAGDDHVWFLRRLTGVYGQVPDPSAPYGIANPEDLQDGSLEAYFRSYLDPDPESALRPYLAAQPELRARVQRYLDYREIERALAVADPDLRCERLLPFWLAEATWDGLRVTQDGIVACGARAGAPLLAAFDDPAHAAMRSNIIDLWGQMRYAPARPVLVDLLRTQATYWTPEAPGQGYIELISAVSALGAIGDAAALPAIQEICIKWERSGDMPQERCNLALAALQAADGD